MPVFAQIKASACATLSAQQVFSRAAIMLVRKNNLANIQFLVEECGFNFCEVTDTNQCTLLHEAVLYGAEQIVRYLLSLGFHVNAKDAEGSTALHRAAERKENAVLIPLLKEYRADMNVKNNSGLAPLHITIVRDNPAGFRALKDAKANMKLKYQEKSWMQLNAEKNKGIITVSELTPLKIKADNAQESEARLMQGIWSPKFNEHTFRKCMQLLLADNRVLNLIETRILIDCYYLINFSAKLTKLRQFLTTHLESGQLILRHTTLLMMRPSWMLSKQEDALWIEGLLDCSHDFITQRRTQLTGFVELLNLLACEYQGIGKYNKSISTATDGLLYSSHEDPFIEAHLFFNRGISKKAILQYNESVSDLQMAFSLAPDQHDFLRAYFFSLIDIHQYDAALAVAIESTCGELSDILRISAHYLKGSLSPIELINAVQRDFQSLDVQVIACDMRAQSFITLERYDKALTEAQHSFDLSEKKFLLQGGVDMGIALCRYLSIYVACNRCEDALSFLLTKQKEYPLSFSCNLNLKSFAAIIFAANQQMDAFALLIKEIKTINPAFPWLVELYVYVALSQINKNNFESALDCLEVVSEIDPDHDVVPLYRKLLFLLTGHVQKSTQIAVDATPDVINMMKREDDNKSSVDENKQADDPDVDPDLEKELLWEHYDPVKVHEFFQEQKKQLLANINQNLYYIHKPKIRWEIGDKAFVENNDGLVALNSLFYPNYYAVIDPELRLERTVRERLQNALNHGFCNKKLGENGIKILKNSLAELKIDGNLRLYTRVIHKNPQGNYLIVFNKIGDHELIKRMLQKNKSLQIVTLSELQNYVKSSGYGGTFFNNNTQQLPPIILSPLSENKL